MDGIGMAVWWTVLCILVIEDLLTQHLSVWLLWSLGTATVFAVVFSWWIKEKSGEITLPDLFTLAEKGAVLCILMGGMLVSCRRGTLGRGDLWVILMITILFPVMAVLESLIFGFLHAGVMGMIRMAFLKERKPRIPLVPLLCLGLWCSL